MDNNLERLLALLDPKRLRDGLKIGGRWFLQCWEDFHYNPGEECIADIPQSELKYVKQPNGISFKLMRLKWAEEVHNIWTDEGLDSILDVYWNSATQITTWYCGIFESDTTPDGDTTYATPGFTECTAYEEATRPEYETAAASSQSVTNSANRADFTMNDSKTIYGAFICGGGTNPTGKGDTTSGGTLPVAGKFGTAQPVIATNVLSLTYTNGAADDGV